ncbi:MAG: LysR family transcriptional regulator [Planctomycetota bacterium]|nr:LysR family transcriptional regulator [Planctomycetota bacterium]
MDWDDLRFVLATARAGTLVGAATSLNVTHTTVSRRLRSLEKELGVLLFDRTPDGWLPTAAGEDLVDTAAGMEVDVLSLEGRVLGRDRRLTGALEVTTIDSLAESYAEDFSSFVERYPDVKLNINIDDSVRSLSRREADVAIRLTNNPDDYLVGRKAGHMNFAVFGARELANSFDPDSPLSSFPWIARGGLIMDPYIDSWFERHVPNARFVYRVDNESVLLNTVRSGIGLAHLLCISGDLDPGLVRMCPVIPDWTFDVWLLTHPDLRGSARVRAFMNHMAACITARRGAMTGKLGKNEPRAHGPVLACPPPRAI